VRRTALKIRTRRDTARSGRCFRDLFVLPFGPGALPDGFVNLVRVG
jgi:hypothetical protein